MTMAQQWQEEGLQKGIQKGMQLGRQEGRQEAMRRVVHQMLAKGLDHSTIKAYTQLSDEELKALLHQPGH